jgi:hypothetical protein
MVVRVLCCFSGDLLDRFPNAATKLHDQTRWVRDWLKTYPGRLYICTGNHDWWPNPDHHLDNDAEGGWLRKARRPGLGIDGASELHLGRRCLCADELHCPRAVVHRRGKRRIRAKAVVHSHDGDPGIEALGDIGRVRIFALSPALKEPP